ncbi:MAG: lactate racemase domain-containing protein [Syntrophothermus sp.]
MYFNGDNFDVKLPKMVKVEQIFEAPQIKDVAGEVATQVRRSGLKARLKPGSRVAIAVGSRGIAHLAEIVRTLVQEVKAMGGEPFVVPAMGSHGGATAAGQAGILAGYGVTETGIGAPVRSSMEVVRLGETSDGVPVYLDKLASQADAIIPVNRVKVHTDFQSDLESGLVKMLVIGLGKHAQALAIHQKGVYGLRVVIPEAARIVLERAPIALGLATVENAYDQPAILQAVEPQDFFTAERALLAESKRLMPRLPVPDIDTLIVDQLGKNISGTGMDTNIIGRIQIRGEAEPDQPRITMIAVLDVSEESHGNVTGVGLADFTTRRLVEKIDYQAFYANIITSTFPERGKIPVICENDELAIKCALRCCWGVEPSQARVVRIKNTLELREAYVSESIWREIQARKDLRLLEKPAPFAFDSRGNLF